MHILSKGSQFCFNVCGAFLLSGGVTLIITPPYAADKGQSYEKYSKYEYMEFKSTNFDDSPQIPSLIMMIIWQVHVKRHNPNYACLINNLLKPSDAYMRQ